MNAPLRIGIVLSSTREGRFADRPAAWITELAKRHTAAAELSFEVVDLRDYPMPFFDEPRSPVMVKPRNEVALRWAEKVGSLDGFVFITAEYNHGIPAVLKNAIDYVYAEWNKKPAAFIAYGNAGGARAVEQLRMNLVEVEMAPLRWAVHIGRAEFIDMLLNGKTFGDFPHLEDAGKKLLDDVAWWAKALHKSRTA